MKFKRKGVVMRKRVNAFTVVELMIIIAIIFIFIGMILPSMVKARMESQISQVAMVVGIDAKV